MVEVTVTQPPPFCIQLEFVEGCNLRCGFCGIRNIREKGDKENLSGPYKYMDPNHLEKIASNIAGLQWNSRIEIAVHGEPTKHPQFYEMVETIRSYLPKNSIMLTTNGIPLLEGDIVTNLNRALNAGLNCIAVDDYRPHRVAPHIRENIDSIQALVVEYPEDKRGNPNLRRKAHERVVSIVKDISQAESGTHSNLWNHAGSASPPDYSRIDQRCAKPFRELTIRWDSNVAICCDDWTGKYAIGNAYETTLNTIWQHERFIAARKALMNGRHGITPCAGCNHSTYRNGLLPFNKGKKAQLPPITEHDWNIIQEAVNELEYTQHTRREIPVALNRVAPD